MRSILDNKPVLFAFVFIAMALCMSFAVVPTLSSAIEGEQQAQQRWGSVDFVGTAQKQEVVYARLEADGSPRALYVVNAFEAPAGSVVQDFGSYEQVANLSTTDQLLQMSDSVTLRMQDETFSYEGDAPSGADLPWEVGITYRLDGVEVDASDLAGASGALEIGVSLACNPAADPAYFENYLATVSIALPRSHATQVRTDDGSIALAGSDTQVTFMAMPGAATSSTMRAQVEGFEMDGIQIAAIPLALGMDLPDTGALIGQFEALSDAAGQLADGTDALASGAGDLARGAARLASSATVLADGIDDYMAGVQQAASGAGQTVAGQERFADGLAQLKDQSSQLRSKLAPARATFDSAVERYQGLDPDQRAQVDEQLRAVGLSIEQLGAFGAYLDGFDAYLLGVEGLHDSYAPLLEGSQQGAAGLDALAEQGSSLSAGARELAGGVGLTAESTDELHDGAAELAAGSDEFATQTHGLPEAVQHQIDEFVSAYDTSDFTPRSFVDARNTGVELVQFVMSTDAITAPEVEKPAQPEEPERSLIDRFLALFA